MKTIPFYGIFMARKINWGNLIDKKKEQVECFTLNHSLTKRFFGRHDFTFNATETSNIRQKWLSICFNINFIEGSIELFLNGNPLLQKETNNSKQWLKLGLPPDWQITPMIVRLGRYFFDGSPMIGKIVDFNLWER